MSVWGIVLAAGSGTRFGGPKVHEALGGLTIVQWSMDAATTVCDSVVLVGQGGVTGGETRAGSVRAGLAAVPSDAEIIVVHDAARPLATVALFAAVIDAVRAGADGAVPAVPVIDTVKRVEGTAVLETLDRRSLVAVQTPQAFAASVLRRAHGEGADATDDAALVEALGGTVVVVPGEPRNRKITTREDLDWARAMIGT